MKITLLAPPGFAWPDFEAAARGAFDGVESLLRFETDCWDVHDAIAKGRQDFVLLDVRSPELYDAGHVPGAINLPHRRIIERNLADHPDDTTFVVYCAGPHCNGADKAAVRLASWASDSTRRCLRDR